MLFVLVASTARAATYTVGEGESIGDALAIAACGDTIELTASSYVEDINLWAKCPEDNRIHIIGVTDARPLVTAKHGYAISFNGSGFIVEHIELTSDPQCGQDNRVIFGNGTHFDFIDLYVHDGGYDGIGTYCGAEDVRVIDSEIARNGLGCIDSDGNLLNGDGIDLFGCLGCEVGGDYIHGNNFNALSAKGGNADTWVHDSVMYSTSQYALELGQEGQTSGCDDTEILLDNMLFERNVVGMYKINGWPVRVGFVQDLTFRQNTVVVFDNTDPHPMNPDGVSGGFIITESGVGPEHTAVFQNNIFANFGLPLYEPLAARDGSELALDELSLQMDHNLFYSVDEGFTDSPDGDSTSLVADPLFIDFPTNLGLSKGSPAIDAGVDLGDDSDGAAPDLGAFEFGEDGIVPSPPEEAQPGSGVPPGACGCASSPTGSGRWKLGLILACLVVARARRAREDRPS
ncbi:MAG: hypothetical protein GXP62_16575 [Oligoflexia bacterium]|nr:hypothetical protein [Oligoflexia bacterium]